MKIPTEVKVGPHIYRVVVDEDRLLVDSGQLGHTNKEKLIIAIEADQAPSQLADTLIHELVHAMLSSMGLDEGTEERVANGLAPDILLLMQDNPELIKYLQG